LKLISPNQGLIPMPETSGLGLSSGGNAKAAEQFSAGQLDIEALVEYRSPTTNMGC
jgi:hypothetical protein